MSDPRWSEVDEYIGTKLLGEDAALSTTLTANATAGLPEADVSAAQGRMLQLFARMCGARRVLEIGTLGGYSTIWLARALPEGGALVTLELDPHHASVARDNLAAAGLAHLVEVMVGPAMDSLKALDGTFDFIFIDADKPSNVTYLREALRLSRPGTVIVVDNVVRSGGVLDPLGDASVQGTRALFDALQAEPRVTATTIQTVGSKGWDGFLLAAVNA